MRRNKRLLGDGAHNGRAAVVADGAVFAQATHMPAAPAEPLLLCDLLRHESRRRHIGQDGIGRVGGGCQGGTLPLLLLLLLFGFLSSLGGIGLLSTQHRRVARSATRGLIV